jgi:hypothetical protein
LPWEGFYAEIPIFKIGIAERIDSPAQMNQSSVRSAVPFSKLEAARDV